MAQLKKTERQEISYYLKRGYGPTAIGEMLGRDKSVISREIRRNTVDGKYQANKAQMKSYQRRYWVMTEAQKVRSRPELVAFIEQGLKQKNPWSPEQISGRWNKIKSIKYGYKISAPTIYKYLYEHRSSLCKYLCTKRYKKNKRHPKLGRQMIQNRVWIDDRSSVVDEKQRLGDWEGDTICSIKEDKTSLLVLHDRASRFICASKSCDKQKKRIARKIRKLLKGKPKHTLSVDNGIEFKGHKSFDIATFFCHPYSSWEKGAVEYSNRLLRRHFPKKTKLFDISPKKLSIIVEAINNTPRKCLDYNTPAEIFFQKQFLSFPNNLPSVAFAPLI